MKYPIADEGQDNDVALRAAAHSRWVELRQQRQPRDAERHDWIQALLMGEEVRSLDSDVLRVDRIAQTLLRRKWSGGRRSTSSSRDSTGCDRASTRSQRRTSVRLRTSVLGRTSRRPGGE
jgi:hypothetical protein